jgi:hypothetical protein
MNWSRALAGAVFFGTFVLVAVVQSWPLAANLSTRLTGDPGGDTGVYVWNVWVFRHELLSGRWPLQTDTILLPTGPADLSLHNYTVSANLLALPLQQWLDVVTSFNLVYLINVALAGLGAYLLARRLSPTHPVGRASAWIAGVLFACSPFMLARSTAHFSLVASAALPFFVVALDRTWHGGRWLDAVAVGVCLAWAAYSDPYYAVYCAVLGLAFVVGHTTDVHAVVRAPGRRRLTAVVDIALGTAVILVGVVVLGPTDSVQVGSLTVSLHSLYTPVLLLTVLTVTRILLAVRPRLTFTTGLPSRWVSLALVAAASAAVLLSPLFLALARRAMDGRFVAPPIMWRSSAPGVDLLSFFVPNPMHPLAPAALVDWLSSQPGRFEENVVSIPWVAIAVIVAARLVTGRWSSRLWLAFGVFAGLLALGPFLRVAGVQTYVPTPWALLRYVPVIAEARMPARFGVLVALAVAMLFASSLSALARQYPARARAIVVVACALLVAELWPVPRALFSAELRAIYTVIARDPRPVSVLELPVGARDGLSSLGDYSARSQFRQTIHGKPLVGGYLSRLSDARKDIILQNAFLSALFEKSERKTLSDDGRAAARAAALAFADEVNLGYVVIDEPRTTPALRDLAIESLGLLEIGRDGPLRLYVPSARANAL